MDSSTRRRRRAVSTFVAGVCVSLLLTGCGFDKQTLQDYTPAQGVNVDIPAGPDGRQLKVRNLLVVTDDDGGGLLSASIVSPVADRLVSVEGTPHRADNSAGAPLTVSGSPVVLQPNRMVVLGEEPSFTVASPDLTAGYTVDLTLTFASGAQASAIAPVMGFDDPIYASLAPSPSPSPTAEAVVTPAAMPAASATPAP